MVTLCINYGLDRCRRKICSQDNVSGGHIFRGHSDSFSRIKDKISGRTGIPVLPCMGNVSCTAIVSHAVHIARDIAIAMLGNVSNSYS